MFGTAIVSIILEVLNISFPAILFVSLSNILYAFVIGNRFLSIKKLRSIYKIIIIFLFISSLYVLKKNPLSEEKYILIIYNIFLPIFVLIFINSLKKNNTLLLNWTNKKWQNYLFFMTIVSILLFMLFKQVGVDGRPILPGMENPIWVGRHFGGLFIALLYFSFEIRNNSRFLINLVFSALLVYIFFMVGSRAVIISTIIVFIIFITNKVQLTSTKKNIFGFIVVVLVFYGLYYFYIYLLESNTHQSLFARLELLQLLNFTDLLTVHGNGLGSWGPTILGLQERHYPHNILVEILFELGILGMIFSIYVFRYLFNWKTLYLSNYLAFYFFLLSMSSGDIPGNNFLFLSIFLVYYYHRKNYDSIFYKRFKYI